MMWAFEQVGGVELSSFPRHYFTASTNERTAILSAPALENPCSWRSLLRGTVSLFCPVGCKECTQERQTRRPF